MLTKRLAAIPFLLAPALLATYTYCYSASFISVDTSKWFWVGDVVAPGTGGFVGPGANGSALISNIAVPDGSSEYEVKMTLTLTTSGGNYITYVRASNDALSGPVPSGTFYAVEVHNPTFNGSVCTATLALYRQLGGVTTQSFAPSIPCG